MDRIKFSFSGGMADNHELNFYEAGRFQYAAARFVYTVEKFRQEKRVAARLTTKINADIRVRAAEKSSWIQEVVVVATPILMQCAVEVPFDVMISYVWDILTRSRETEVQNVAVELAKQMTAQRQIDLGAQKEHTAQLDIFARVVETQAATTCQALDILKVAVEDRLTVETDDLRASTQDIESLKEETESRILRAEAVEPFRGQLAAIDPRLESKLASQLRSSVNDMALPLRSSANRLAIGDERSNISFARLDERSAELIYWASEDAEPTFLRGSIKMYDVETGYGRFRYQEIARPLSFRVPGALKDLYRDQILEEMKRDETAVSVYIIRDAFGESDVTYSGQSTGGRW